MNTSLSSQRTILDSYKRADRSDFFKLVQDVDAFEQWRVGENNWNEFRSNW